MALTTSNQALIAFKRLYGKGNTDDNKGLNNEGESSSVLLNASDIFLDDIDSDPNIAINDGVAEFINGAEFVQDTTSNGHGFFLQYPTGHSKAGQRIRNAIPTSYGSNYQIQIYDSGGNSISLLDARNWIYDYSSGIFFQQTPNASPAPATADVYVYIGNFISDVISSTGITGTYTEGSVLFSDSNGTITENNSEFYWDSQNNYLGIQTNSPNYPLDVNGIINGAQLYYNGQDTDNRYAPLSHTHAASAITSGQFADARISQSNITQHESAIDHNNLTNYNSDEHIDHSNITVTGINSLTGGGDLTTSQTLDIADNGVAVEELDLSISPNWTATHTFGAGLDAGSNKITSVDDPTNPNDAANKNYVDAIEQGLNIKDSVRVASTGNITLTGTTNPNPIDGVTLSNNDRILLKDQNDASENGLYLTVDATDPSTWIRTADADEDSEVTTGLFMFVSEGTENGNSSFILTTPNPITVDVTDQNYTVFTKAGEIQAGNGLIKNGNILNVRLDIDDSNSNVTGVYGINFTNLLDVTDDNDNTVSVGVNDDLSQYDNSSSLFFDTAGNGLSSTGSTINLDANINQINDVSNNTPNNRHVLVYNGTNNEYENRLLLESDISDLDHYDSNDFDSDFSGKTTDALSEGATNLYFTDERAQDAVGTILTDSSTINFQYQDGSDIIRASVIESGLIIGNITTNFQSGSIPFSDGNNLIEDNNGLYYDSNNQELGVGTNQLNAKLNVSGDTFGETLFQIEGTEGVLFSIDDNLSSGSIFQISNASNTRIFDVQANERVGILTDGNPTEALDVRGHGVFEGDLYPYSGDTYDLGRSSNYWNNLYVNNINNLDFDEFFNDAYPSDYYSLTISGSTVDWDLMDKKQLNAYLLINSGSTFSFTLNLLNPIDATTGELIIEQTANGTITITMPSQSYVQNGTGNGELEIYGSAGERHILGVKCRPDGQGGFNKYWMLEESLVSI